MRHGLGTTMRPLVPWDAFDIAVDPTQQFHFETRDHSVSSSDDEDMEASNHEEHYDGDVPLLPLRRKRARDIVSLCSIHKGHDEQKIDLDHLAVDVQLYILSFLDLGSARALMATNRHFRTLLLSQDAHYCFWMPWCQRRWPCLEKQDSFLFVDSLKLPTAVGSFQKQDANVSLLLSMAPQSQPARIDQSKFVKITAARQHRRTQRQHQQQTIPLLLRSYEKDGKEVVQFTGQVGRGDRCIRSDHPLPRPKLMIQEEQEHRKLSLFRRVCRHAGRATSCCHTPTWRPFVLPYRIDDDDKVFLTPRLVSYFEVSILDEEETVQEGVTARRSSNTKDCVAIGVASDRFKLHSCMPGWDSNSFGYHGDDGGIFHSSGRMVRSYGPSFGKGDTVGCGVDYVARGIFFTLNGIFLGHAWTGVDRRFFLSNDLYPVVGVDTNAPILCNFGERPFVYDPTPFLMKHGDLAKKSFTIDCEMLR